MSRSGGSRLSQRSEMAALLAIGVSATTWTQLRVPGMPFGPGETLLMAWLAWRIAVLSYWPQGFRVDGLTKGVLSYWLVTLTLGALGTTWFIAQRFDLPFGFQHTAPALLFIVVLSALVAQSFASERAADTLGKVLLVTAAGLPAVLLLFSFVEPNPLGLSLKYGGLRFSGLAENPNQVALSVVPLPFLAAQLARDAGSFRQRLLFRLLGACAVAVGVATLSDALILAWACAFALLGGIGAWRLVVTRYASPARWAVLLIVVPLGIVLGLAYVAPYLYDNLERYAAEVYEEGGQGSFRLILWRNGLEAALRSPWFGFGPGAHSGIDGPFQGWEVHNSYIDWATITGLSGLLILLLFMAWPLWTCAHARKHWLIGGLVAVMVFSIFHFVLRHPSLWVFLIWAVAYCRTRGFSGAAGRWPVQSEHLRRAAG